MRITIILIPLIYLVGMIYSDVYSSEPYNRLLSKFNNVLDNVHANGGVITAPDKATIEQIKQDMIEDCSTGKLQEYTGRERYDFKNVAGIPMKVHQVMLAKEITKDTLYWVLPVVDCIGVRGRTKYQYKTPAPQSRGVVKLTPLFNEPPPGPVENGRPKYADKNDDQPSSRAKIYEIDLQYYSGKCNKYEGLLKDILPTDYFADPVKNLKQVYLTINLESKPDEKYYLTVLETYDAYKRGLIKPLSTGGSRTYHGEGIRSEVYLTAPGYFENRLISHSDISRARRYFEQRRDEVCGTATDEKVQVGTVNQGNQGKCLKSYQIIDIENQMEKINLNLEPGVLYYKLVLKTNRAVHCKQLTAIEGTLITGALGVKTEEYFVEDDHKKLRLVSIKDRKQARTFFRERKQKHQPMHVTEPSYSSRNEGHNKNNREVAAGASGALLVAHKAGKSSSDESDNKNEDIVMRVTTKTEVSVTRKSAVQVKT